MPAHSLGYALPPKKDPQYSTWMELLTRADAADPAHRGERVAFLMRQVGGMMETEGHSAAYRVASTLIAEATMHDAGTGIAVARALSDNSVIGWSNLADALLLGMIKRRPDLMTACGVAWCSLALPFYMEPYFRESHLGEFVETAVASVAEGEGETLVEMLRSAIEVQSRAHERSALLRRLHSSARRRGWASKALDDSLLRWEAESPPPRHSYTAMKYDAIKTLSDLEVAFDLESGPEGPGYEAPRAFDRLAPAAGFDAARKAFERWAVLRKESRSRFLLVDLAIEAGREDYARQLVADYEASPDERATWTEWTGGGTLRHFRARAKLYGARIHPQAYEHFLGSMAAGRESITSVLLEIADILPVVAQSPDWAAIWDWLAEQLATTREYSVGPAFDARARETTDEAMIAALFRWALAIPLAELQRQAQVGALRINATVAGQTIFSHLVRALLSGDADEPAQALQLLLLDASESQLTGLRDTVAALVDHPDYAVAQAAVTLSSRWGQPALMTQSALPSFYTLVLEDHDDGFDIPTLTDHGSGAMRVEDPMGWTAMFPAQVNSLARQHVTPAHIRHRSRMFIEQWGGLAAFGKTATDHVQADLRRLEMRMHFWRPHVMVAARALRYVADELRRGGMIPAREAPLLLHSMNFPAPTLPLIAPVTRPLLMPRPTLDEGSWRDRELAEKWVQGVEGDTGPLPFPDAKVIAEISTFETHMVRRARYSLKRVRAPFLEVGNEKDFTGWVDLLPKAIWADGFRALTNEPAPTIVRRLLVSYMPAVPPFQLIICPLWLRQLGWRLHPENWLVYLDNSGQVVARAVWWRDGGPVDIEDDSIWGEGLYISVTSAGLAQIEAIGGSLHVLTHARRKVKPEGGDAEPLARSASGRE